MSSRVFLLEVQIHYTLHQKHSQKDILKTIIKTFSKMSLMLD